IGTNAGRFFLFVCLFVCFFLLWVLKPDCSCFTTVLLVTFFQVNAGSGETRYSECRVRGDQI
ncbi:unnamed protein product, partial [Staurois parvus]